MLAMIALIIRATMMIDVSMALVYSFVKYTHYFGAVAKKHVFFGTFCDSSPKATNGVFIYTL